MFKNIAVFLSSRNGLKQEHKDDAFAFGQIIGKNNARLIFGAGDQGGMGEVLKGALSSNAKVFGVITKKLKKLELADTSTNKNKKIKLVKNLYERKRLMFKKADVVVVLAGGFGTFDEVFDFTVSVYLKSQKKKPLIFLNKNGFYNGLKIQLARLVQDGCVEQETIDYIAFVDNYKDILSSAKKIQNIIDKDNL